MTFSIFESYSIHHHITILHFVRFFDGFSISCIISSSSISSSISTYGLFEIILQFIIDELMCIHNGFNLTRCTSQKDDGPTSISSNYIIP